LHLIILSITQQTQPFLSEFDESLFARFRPFVDTSENNVKKFVGTTGASLYPVGGTGWYMDLVTNHSKPTSISQKHSHCLAYYSNLVVIGYSGHKLAWKLLTIVYKGKPLPEVPSFVLVEFRLEFIVNLLAWFSRKSAHIRTRTSSSS